MVDEACAAFELIGAPEAADLLQRAHAILASRPESLDLDDPSSMKPRMRRVFTLI